MDATTPSIGVLALQGGYAAHAAALADLGQPCREVRRPQALDGLDGLIIPGGESTVLLRLLESEDFFARLCTFARQHPVFGTCAGAILMAARVLDPAQPSLGCLDVTVRRNAYGRQNDSVVQTGRTLLPGPDLEMVFIRAPRIESAGAEVETLAWRDTSPVLVRQGSHLAATFHPELGQDRRVHRLFLDMVAAHAS
ncbi:pyridoxal phosphate synthase yaaE subunit [Arboricoccus pini]|uniref:Pyridoxal phosphate synthase yaaE subunit n=1 Tax=Arboricoccus pini TaxID=1963835 RepID=A0A212RVT6_9PROT|nr:pyridoxal 5'-phosphate synthase glutaminase subunit PdxT [Arboricoccus pini]SNB76788.1 pyridoxal phosphate synthase yaaE subunit [Arboricoccus pini]